MAAETGTSACSCSDVVQNRGRYELLLVIVADAHFGVGLDDIGLDASEENRCVSALSAFVRSLCFLLFCSTDCLPAAANYRDFSWEKNYPGDEGISGDAWLSSFHELLQQPKLHLHSLPAFLSCKASSRLMQSKLAYYSCRYDEDMCKATWSSCIMTIASQAQSRKPSHTLMQGQG